MSPLLSTFWIYLVLASSAWIIGNGLSLILVRVLPAPPDLVRERSRLWLLASLPSLLPSILICSLILLSIAKSFDLVVDHCLEHGGQHPHFCFAHLPELLLSLSHSAFGVIVTAATLTVLARCLIRQVHQHRKAIAFQHLVPTDRPLKTIQHSVPLAFTVGIRNPVIYFSRGLKSTLSKHQQRIVAAHEAAHIRNRDVLKTTLFELLLSFQLNPWILRTRWHFAMEALADERVAQRYNRVDIAEVLLTLKRATIRYHQAVSIDGSDLGARVERLLYPPETVSKPLPDTIICGLLAVLPFALLNKHHSLEDLMGWLLSL